MDSNKFKKTAIPEELQGFARQFAKGYGLGLIKPKLFIPDENKIADEQGYYELDTDKTSIFGTPVFDVVQLNPLSYTDEDGLEVNLVAALSLDIAIIEVNQAKNIVKTARSGKNGTIKEYMGLGDYGINIKGWLVNKIATANPEALTRQFEQYMRAPIDIQINSLFLSYFEIYNIVVESYNVKQLIGQRNTFEYEINAVSETPFEVKYNKERTIAMF